MTDLVRLGTIQLFKLLATELDKRRSCSGNRTRLHYRINRHGCFMLQRQTVPQLAASQIIGDTPLGHQGEEMRAEGTAHSLPRIRNNLARLLAKHQPTATNSERPAVTGAEILEALWSIDP